MTEQQPIHILSRSVSPVSPETDLWAKQHPASPVPSSVSDWSALHPLVEFCFPEELQHCVNHWHDGSNPRPTSIETRVFMRQVGEIVDELVTFSGGTVHVMNQVSRHWIGYGSVLIAHSCRINSTSCLWWFHSCNADWLRYRHPI